MGEEQHAHSEEPDGAILAAQKRISRSRSRDSGAF